MPISFGQIPQGFRVPLYYVEVDPSKAGLPINRLPVMLVGHMIDAVGTATANVPIPVNSQAQADALFGQGSQLACMFQAYFANNWMQESWGLPLAEGTTAATFTVTVATAPTEAGTLHLYVAGHHVPVAVNSDDTVSEVATAIKAAIDADPSLPVSCAAPAAGVCTFTCKGKGLYGSDIKISDSYYGAVGQQVLPAGMTMTYAAGVSGAGSPDCATALTNLGETPVEYVCLPFTDSDNIADWKEQFGFGDQGRWGWVRQLYGHIFSAARGTYSELLALMNPTNTLGNCAQLSVMAVEGGTGMAGSPSPVWEWAAAYTAKAARALSIDPARPLQSLHLEGIMPALAQDRFGLNDLNTLSLNGIATQRTLQDGVPMITRETTTATLNLYGNTDDAYTDTTTLATLAKLLRNQRQVITSKYPRHKLANDGARFGPGQAIVTPKTIKAELVAQYRIDEFQGLCEDADAFKENLIVERDVNDPCRLNILFPPDLVNGLRLFAVLAQFRLQYNRGVDQAMI